MTPAKLYEIADRFFRLAEITPQDVIRGRLRDIGRSCEAAAAAEARLLRLSGDTRPPHPPQQG